MKPTRLHYFFAESWDLKICFFVVPSATAVFFMVAGRAIGQFIFEDWFNLLYIAAILFSLVAGICLAIVLARFVLSPLRCWRTEENGGPFEVGDTVEILAHPHRGRITRVRGIGQHRCSVIVDLSEEARRDHTDEFINAAVMKVIDATSDKTTSGAS